MSLFILGDLKPRWPSSEMLSNSWVYTLTTAERSEECKDITKAAEQQTPREFIQPQLQATPEST